MKISLTGTSIAVFVLSLLAKRFGYEVTEGSLTQLVTDVISIASFVGMVYGQYRRPEVSSFILKNGGQNN